MVGLNVCTSPISYRIETRSELNVNASTRSCSYAFCLFFFECGQMLIALCCTSKCRYRSIDFIQFAIEKFRFSMKTVTKFMFSINFHLCFCACLPKETSDDVYPDKKRTTSRTCSTCQTQTKQELSAKMCLYMFYFSKNDGNPI